MSIEKIKLSQIDKLIEDEEINDMQVVNKIFRCLCAKNTQIAKLISIRNKLANYLYFFMLEGELKGKDKKALRGILSKIAEQLIDSEYFGDKVNKEIYKKFIA